MKHLVCNRIKITEKKELADHMAEKFPENSSSKWKKVQILKQNKENNKISFKSANKENCNHSIHQNKIRRIT